MGFCLIFPKYYPLTIICKSCMLNKNSLAVKKCEANQKPCTMHGYKQPKTLISSKAGKKSSILLRISFIYIAICYNIYIYIYIAEITDNQYYVSNA